MKITEEDIKFTLCVIPDRNDEYFELLLVVVNNQFVIASIIEEETSLGEKPGYLYGDYGDENFFALLLDKGYTQKCFHSEKQIMKEIFPLIREYLADKPDDYFEVETNSPSMEN